MANEAVKTKDEDMITEDDSMAEQSMEASPVDDSDLPDYLLRKGELK